MSEARVTQNFINVTELKAAVAKARLDARSEAFVECGRKGVLQSRGAFIKVIKDKNVVQGECDSWPFEGTAKQFKELADLLRYGSADSIEIDGGFNWAESPRAMADCEYDPWVSEWSVEFGTKEDITAEIEAAAKDGREAAAAGRSINSIPFSISEDQPLREAWEAAWINEPKPVGVRIEDIVDTPEPKGENRAAEILAANQPSEIVKMFQEDLFTAQAELAFYQLRPMQYVVICETLPLAFDTGGGIVRNARHAKPWDATRFSQRDAFKVARNVRNGNDSVGEVHSVVHAIELEIKTLEALLATLEK